MKKFPAVLAATVLGAAGFAAAGIAGGSHLLDEITGTTATTATTTQTTTTDESSGQGRKVALCHHTGKSKKHPNGVTITVSQHAVQAHLRHHDTLGACPMPSTTATDATPSHGSSSGHGNGNGHGGGHGHGHGKP
jgi:hypothetical protein